MSFNLSDYGFMGSGAPDFAQGFDSIREDSGVNAFGDIGAQNSAFAAGIANTAMQGAAVRRIASERAKLYREQQGGPGGILGGFLKLGAAALNPVGGALGASLGKSLFS